MEAASEAVNDHGEVASLAALRSVDEALLMLMAGAVEEADGAEEVIRRR